MEPEIQGPFQWGHWKDQKERRAITWLCQATNKEGVLTLAALHRSLSQDCNSGQWHTQAGPRKPAGGRLPSHPLLEGSGNIPTLWLETLTHIQEHCWPWRNPLESRSWFLVPQKISLCQILKFSSNSIDYSVCPDIVWHCGTILIGNSALSCLLFLGNARNGHLWQLGNSTSKCPSTSKWINKRWYVHTMEYY